MTVLRLHSEPLLPGWIDTYGHLNQAYYLVPFSNASWALQELLGVGRSYFETAGGAIYTIASHITYRREVRAPARLDFESAITAVSEKRFAFAHRMLVDDQETTVFETIVAHVDTNRRATSPLPAATALELRRLCVNPPPSWVTGGVSLDWKSRRDAKPRLGQRV